MSEPLETWIDAAIGETREALVREGKPIALRVARASDEGRRARWGELYCARVREVDKRRRGAYLDLGLRDQQGFLPLGDDGRVRMRKERVVLHEGQGVIVAVTREAARTKNPVLDLSEIGHDGEAPHRIGQHECDSELILARAADPAIRAKLDASIEDSLARTAPIPGGGALTIEPTSALVAIDVDAGGRAGSGDPERFALDLNVAAAIEAARQIRLRNLAGIIAIDFVSMRAKSHGKQLEEAVRQAFAGDPWSIQFGALSRFGVFDLARAQLRTPLHEQLRDVDGRLSTETVALMALRAIEREGRAQTGRQIACTVSPDVKAWLDAAEIDWRAQLSNSIGMRWTLDAQPGPRDRIDARAL
ncbi:ribonuclease E/G [Terricaulis silvestris]|uniref:Ribonuclease E n=1 Tax=Terricaulis silvestris TaxID=2686094 RepID=A0A6I6MIC7_9CAUL|nr:ribonuclease E/G [Terricaulis silvestris]QGZ94820.1 Ribonuclease E [Terricaulis silvestris]